MRRKGFTLLEMMVVVSIIGIMTGLAAYNISNIITRGRINGTTQQLAQTLASARTRAIAMACPISVQINGPLYNPTTVPPNFVKSGIVVFRKDVCDPSATPNGFFQTGDHVLQTIPIDPTAHPILQLPASVITSNSGKLSNSAVVISWGMQGGSLVRNVYADSSGSGAFNLTSINGTDFAIDVLDYGGTATNRAFIPDKGAPHMP